MDFSEIENILRASGRVNTLQSYPDMEIVIILAIAAMMVVVAAMLMSVRPHLVPPGPRLLPVIGNLHLLYNKDLRTLFQKFGHVYGDIFSLYVGRRLVVVVSGKRLLKEVFVKNADIFSNRPCEFGHDRLKVEKGILYNNGQIWQHHRRFVSTALRDLLGSGSTTIESNIAPEMIHLTSAFMELAQHAFDPSSHLRAATSNVVFSAMLGTRFDTDDPEFTQFYKSLRSVMHPPDIQSLVQTKTWLHWIPGYTYDHKKKKSKQVSELEEFVCRQIKNRLDNRRDADDDVDDDDDDNASGHSGGVASCVADAYIKKIRHDAQQGINASFPVENLIQMVLELVYAGTEWTAVTLEWVLLCLTLHPQCQERARSEIDLVLDGAFPSFADHVRLPYLEAVILESQRLADIAPFSMLHLSTNDAVVEGLQIPADTIMVPNMTSVFYDTKLFPRPEEFRPERFLDDRGTYLRKAVLNPFFIGKRSCLGENLARLEIFLFTTALLQHFWFSLPEDAPPPSLQGIMGTTRRPPPYKITVAQRQL